MHKKKNGENEKKVTSTKLSKRLTIENVKKKSQRKSIFTFIFLFNLLSEVRPV